MTTDLDRLKEWMESIGYNSTRLAQRMEVSNSLVSSLLKGKRPIADSFKWRFRETFGSRLAHIIFTDAAPNKEQKAQYYSEKNTHPQKYAAHRAVRTAIVRGELLPASNYLCVNCNDPAHEWHHPSYEPDDELNVIPLCRKCHRLHHGRNKLDIPLGVVPTSVGMVRIAIAP